MIENLNFNLVDALPVEVAIADPVGDIVKVNRKWLETARDGNLARRPTPWNYLSECEAAIDRGCREASDVLSGLRRVIDGDAKMFATTYGCPFAERYHWYQVVISPLQASGVRHAVLMHVDVSVMQRDALTGVPNRTMFDAQLAYMLSLARSVEGRTGVVFVDVDYLKEINDRYGHVVGDAALRTIVRELQAAVGTDGFVARIGGDEFGVVLPLNGSALAAGALRARFQRETTFPIGEQANGTSVSASVGLAMYPEDGQTVPELLKAADRAMYAEKRGKSMN